MDDTKQEAGHELESLLALALETVQSALHVLESRLDRVHIHASGLGEICHEGADTGASGCHRGPDNTHGHRSGLHVPDAYYFLWVRLKTFSWL